LANANYKYVKNKNPTKNILRRWLSNNCYWFWFVT